MLLEKCIKEKYNENNDLFIDVLIYLLIDSFIIHAIIDT